MGRRALLCVVLLGQLLAGYAAAADGKTPERGDRERFRACRAAIFYHLEPRAQQGALPRAFAEALLEQYDFIMFETVRLAPQGSVAAERRSLGFIEDFFLNFGEALAAHAAEYRDTQKREAALIACQPFVWRMTRVRIDHLMSWRERAVAGPPLPPELTEELRAFGLRQAP